MANLNWSYQGNNGKNRQSIGIETKEVKKDAFLGLFWITWKLSTGKESINVRHSFHMNFEDKDNQSA
uniref:Uncharacterized protein n=1 Tax=Falco tinnunculus TaxID=100819 RepID=A0A8C4UES1_FALTI